MSKNTAAGEWNKTNHAPQENIWEMFQERASVRYHLYACEFKENNIRLLCKLWQPTWMRLGATEADVVGNCWSMSPQFRTRVHSCQSLCIFSNEIQTCITHLKIYISEFIWQGQGGLTWFAGKCLGRVVTEYNGHSVFLGLSRHPANVLDIMELRDLNGAELTAARYNSVERRLQRRRWCLIDPLVPLWWKCNCSFEAFAHKRCLSFEAKACTL